MYLKFSCSPLELGTFTLSSNPELAKEISESIGVPQGNCEVHHFADGEINVSIKESNLPNNDNTNTDSNTDNDSNTNTNSNSSTDIYIS